MHYTHRHTHTQTHTHTHAHAHTHTHTHTAQLVKTLVGGAVAVVADVTERRHSNFQSLNIGWHSLRFTLGMPGFGMPGFGMLGFGMPGFGIPGFGMLGFLVTCRGRRLHPSLVDYALIPLGSVA